MCTSDYNQIEFSTPPLVPHVATSPHPFLHGLPPVVCSNIMSHQSEEVCSFRLPVSLCSAFFYFFFGISHASDTTTAFDTNHLQVISLDRTLNPLISLETEV